MSRAELIEKWFAEHDGEDDFVRCGRIYPYSIIGPREGAARIIYLTKSSILFAAQDVEESLGASGVICRVGLPNDSDVVWLRNFIGPRELLFVGDLDPADILVFAWLRERLPPARITHVGISDQFISRLRVTVPDSFRIRLNPTENDAVSLLEDLLPNARETIGHECLEILNEGYKIELEAIVSALGSASPLISLAADW